MKSNNSFQVQRGFYSLASDPNNGANGTYDTGINLPENAIITAFSVDSLVAPVTADAGLTIQFGLASTDGSGINTTNALMVATSNTAFTAGTVIDGNDLVASPIKTKHSNKVTMTIVETVEANEPLTAGILYFTIEYTNNNI